VLKVPALKFGPPVTFVILFKPCDSLSQRLLNKYYARIMISSI
jgi:hypothetical protein